MQDTTSSVQLVETSQQPCFWCQGVFSLPLRERIRETRAIVPDISSIAPSPVPDTLADTDNGDRHALSPSVDSTPDLIRNMHTPVNTLSPFATHWQSIPSGRSYNLWDSRETERWYHQLHEEVSRLTELASGTKHTPAGCCRVSGLQHQQRPSHWHYPHPKNHHDFLLLHCQSQYLTITLHSPLIDSNPTLKASLVTNLFD